ncbi:hypothetical protein ACLOJK_004397 [Asimina triloba]
MCTKLPYPAGVPYNGTPSSPAAVPHLPRLQQLPTARQPVDGEQCGRQQAHHDHAHEPATISLHRPDPSCPSAPSKNPASSSRKTHLHHQRLRQQKMGQHHPIKDLSNCVQIRRLQETHGHHLPFLPLAMEDGQQRPPARSMPVASSIQPPFRPSFSSSVANRRTHHNPAAGSRPAPIPARTYQNHIASRAVQQLWPTNTMIRPHHA